jgi:hypothetical protein
MTTVLVLKGHRDATEGEWRNGVIRAIRNLAKQGRQKRTVLRYAEIVLAGWQETSLARTFNNVGLSESEFISLLTSVVKEQDVDYRRVTEIAAKVVPFLSLARGRKVTAASAAHAFLLENAISLLGRVPTPGTV